MRSRNLYFYVTLSDFLAGGLWPPWPSIIIVNRDVYIRYVCPIELGHVCTSLQGRLESIVFLQGSHLPAKSYFEREEENGCWKITSIATLNPFGYLNTLRFSSHTENVFTNPTENEHKAAPTSKIHREMGGGVVQVGVLSSSSLPFISFFLHMFILVKQVLRPA